MIRTVDNRFMCPACGQYPKDHPHLGCDLETGQDVVDACCAFHRIEHTHATAWHEAVEQPEFRGLVYEEWCVCGMVLFRKAVDWMAARHIEVKEFGVAIPYTSMPMPLLDRLRSRLKR